MMRIVSRAAGDGVLTPDQVEGRLRRSDAAAIKERAGTTSLALGAWPFSPAPALQKEKPPGNTQTSAPVIST